MSGIAKTLHELFSIQHHRLLCHMGPDPLWQVAPWLTRALQLIRQRSVGFHCPGATSAPKLVALWTLQHTSPSPVCGA